VWNFGRGRVALLVLPFAAACAREPCGPSEAALKGPQVRLDVALETCNFTPEARVGPIRRVHKKRPVMLDGSTSLDRNGDPLTYQWAIITQPAQSTAKIDGPRARITGFTPDSGGFYKLSLTVSDGELSSTTEEFVFEADNFAPIANAGADVTAAINALATLDGSMSTDEEKDVLTYKWVMKDRPMGSAAALDDPTKEKPRFSPDVVGVYRLGLTVNDGDVDSAEDIVRVGGGITGSPPFADAGRDVQAVNGVRVMLNGTGSRDPEGAPLTYDWRVGEQPPRAVAPGTFEDSTLVRPLFTPAKEGVYTIDLVVNDGFYDSQISSVRVTTVLGTGNIGDPCEPAGCPLHSICLAEICVPRGGCGMKTEAGSDTPETHTIDLGQPSGTFDFTFDTYVQQDSIVVSYEGVVLFSTGCVGAAGTKQLTYSGMSTEVTVTVTPNCAGGSGTQWDFQVDCPI